MSTGPDDVLEIDCATGDVSTRPLTAGEAAAREEREQAPDPLAAAMERRAEAAEVVQARAASDPDFAALATLLGLA